MSIAVFLDQSLLVWMRHKQESILAHDTLAPIVIRAFTLSDAPGQRATRILNNKLSYVGYQMATKDLKAILAYLTDQEERQLK